MSNTWRFKTGNPEYERYIHSAGWRLIANQRLELDNHICPVCGGEATDVHHLTYERFGQETMDDLVSLCRRCHNQAEELYDPAITPWAMAEVKPNGNNFMAAMRVDALQIAPKVYEYLTSDMTANGIMGKCKRITKRDLRIGDFVFKTNISGCATHIGYVADNELNIIEAKGRDHGVIQSKLSGWSVYGRPPYWTEEEVAKLQGTPQAFVFTRILKYGRRGNDVCELKKLLKANGYEGLTLTNPNYYGATRAMVKQYQKDKGLKVDGIVGPLTIAALGGRWNA